MKQQSLASLTYEGMKKRTKREKFLKEMEQVVPWDRLEKLIESPLSQGWEWPPTERAESDAADLLPATMVRPVRPGS